jgi:oligogalacturonide lyase
VIQPFHLLGRAATAGLALGCLGASLFLFGLPAAGQAARPATAPSTAPAAEPPTSWVDADTGHVVHRLTREPSSTGLYFNYNAFTPDGREMVYSTPGGIRALDLGTRESRLVVGGGRVRAVELGRKTRTLYYVDQDERALYAADLGSGERRKVGVLPRRGNVFSINADESLAAGIYTEGEGREYGQNRVQPSGQSGPLVQPLNKGQMMEERFAAHLPVVLFTMDLRTGEVKKVLPSTDWLGHVLFSPADPTLLMYCHEGPWHKLDRIWQIRTDGTRNRLLHRRTMAMEIAGHEFWGADGKWIWFDLQRPKGEVFFLAGHNVETGERRWYHLERNEWSIHFNVNADGTLFCGDGGDAGQVAHAPDGKWIELFRPEMVRVTGENAKDFVQPGVLRAQRLVNMARHDYRLEPNVRFSPDGRMVIFTSNMFGPSYVFGVEVGKAAPRTAGTGGPK